MKKYDSKKVMMALTAMFQTNGFKEITLTMKCNGDMVTVCPCGYDIESLADVDYFLVRSPSLPFIGGDTLEKVSENLARYQELVEENENAKREYARYIKENGYWDPEHPECFSWQASDIHKDIWGFRPHSVERLEEVIAKYA